MKTKTKKKEELLLKLLNMNKSRHVNMMKMHCLWAAKLYAAYMIIIECLHFIIKRSNSIGFLCCVEHDGCDDKKTTLDHSVC